MKLPNLLGYISNLILNGPISIKFYPSSENPSGSSHQQIIYILPSRSINKLLHQHTSMWCTCWKFSVLNIWIIEYNIEWMVLLSYSKNIPQIYPYKLIRSNKCKNILFNNIIDRNGKLWSSIPRLCELLHNSSSFSDKLSNRDSFLH